MVHGNKYLFLMLNWKFQRFSMCVCKKVLGQETYPSVFLHLLVRRRIRCTFRAIIRQHSFYCLFSSLRLFQPRTAIKELELYVVGEEEEEWGWGGGEPLSN